MTDTKTWVRFKKSGVLIGYAHPEGDVAEIDAEKADKGIEDGVLVRAKQPEIDAAKIKLVEAAAREAAAAAPQAQGDVFALIAQLQAQVNALTPKK